jgi:hypothetical protein
MSCPFGFCVLVWLSLHSAVSSRLQPPSHHFEPLDFDRSPLDQLRSQLGQSPARWKRSVFDVESSEHGERFDYRQQSVAKDFHDRWTIDSLPTDDSDDHFRRKVKLKRSVPVPPPNHFELKFRAHQRDFSLQLHAPHSSRVFAPDARFESTGRGLFHYSTNRVLQGHVAGQYHPLHIDRLLNNLLILFCHQMTTRAKWKVC